MVNYWYIKIAGSKCKKFDDILKKSIEGNIKSIGIGYYIYENYNNINKEYRDNIWINNKKDIKKTENIFNKFINQMKINDIVFLCKGAYQIMYIATISGNYYYDDSFRTEFPEYSLPHRREITNIIEFNTKSPKRMVGNIYKV